MFYLNQMSNITVTYRDGRVSQLEQVYIRGSKIRFLILPDMLKNAPMLKSMKNKNQGAGAGRGKAAILKAQGWTFLWHLLALFHWVVRLGSERLGSARFVFPLQFSTALEWEGLFTCSYSCGTSNVTAVTPEKLQKIWLCWFKSSGSVVPQVQWRRQWRFSPANQWSAEFTHHVFGNGTVQKKVPGTVPSGRPPPPPPPQKCAILKRTLLYHAVETCHLTSLQ